MNIFNFSKLNLKSNLSQESKYIAGVVIVEFLLILPLILLFLALMFYLVLVGREQLMMASLSGYLGRHLAQLELETGCEAQTEQICDEVESKAQSFLDTSKRNTSGLKVDLSFSNLLIENENRMLAHVKISRKLESDYYKFAMWLLKSFDAEEAFFALPRSADAGLVGLNCPSYEY